MPLSDDPEKRARQLANLKPGAGAWRPGASPNLKHGLYTRRPERVLLGSVFSEIVDALEDQVPLRGPDGQMLGNFVMACEVAAIQMVRVRRALGYLATNGEVDERGRPRPEAEALEKSLERLFGYLDKLGATPTSYARLGFDVARTGVTVAELMADHEPGPRADVEGDGVDG